MAFDRKSFQSFAGKVQEKMEDMFPGTLVIDGREIACACVGGEKSRSHEPGGYSEDMGRLVRVRKDVLEISPVLGDTMTLDGEDVRVSSVGIKKWEDSWAFRVGVISG